MSLQDEILELKKLLSDALQEISDLKSEIETLKSENAALKSRLNQNSKNSSNPPSRDGYQKDSLNLSRILRSDTKKQRGGQIGHKGDTLRQVEEPDKIIAYFPETCECGYKFDGTEKIHSSEKRQEFEIPPIQIEVIEHQIHKCQCPHCGKMQAGKAPNDINSAVQYGNRIKSLLVLLSCHFKLPINKVQELINHLLKTNINEATIIDANAKSYAKLETTEKELQEQIIASKVAHLDETGVRVAKELNWFHIATTELYTYIFPHAKRGLDAINSTKSVVPKLTNWVVHDCWASYFSFTNVKHSVCLAHIIRELQGIIDNNPNLKSIWAKDMQEFIIELIKLKNEGRVKQRANILKDYDDICKFGIALTSISKPKIGKKGRVEKTKAQNLLNRLISLKAAVLAFAFNDEVPPTNNLAERNLRATKVKMKVSNCFRSFEGAEYFARIHSFIATCKQNNKNIFDEMYNTFCGFNFLTVKTGK